MSLLQYFGIKTDFERIFFIREFNALSGKQFSGLVLLFIILFATLLALGYAVGGLQLLDARMNNPYTNWVDVTIKNEDRDTIDAIRKYFSQNNTKEQFNIRNVTDHVIMLDPVFVSQETGQLVELKGRTISQSDVILETILNPRDGNWLSGLTYDGNTPVQFNSLLGIIATRSMLTKLGYSNPEQQKQVYARENGIVFLIPVEAVVEELPNYCDFCFTQEFYNLFLSNYLESRFLPVERGSVNKFDFVADGADSSALIAWWNDRSPNMEVAYAERKSITINTTKQNHLYRMTLNQYPLAKDLDSLFLHFQRDFEAKGHRCAMVFTPNLAAAADVLQHPHYMAFNFVELSKVDGFKTFMSKKFGFEINLAQIEAKKNFSIVSSLTWLMGALLFVFSLASIIFFVDNLLRSHLEKIRSNLGTFMAFGLSNVSLRRSYLRIVIVYMSICIISAMFAVVLFDLGEEKVTTMSKFNIFDWKILLAIMLLLSVGIIKSWATIDAILKNTPGNLIYDRE